MQTQSEKDLYIEQQLADIRKANAEGLLAAKKAKWYEAVLVGAGVAAMFKVLVDAFAG